jgi:hypothetical protein
MRCLDVGTGDRQFREQKTWSRAQKASFWNLAREDYIAAYINHTITRLDGNDISLWQAAGLLIGEDGSIMSSDLPKSELMDRANEDMFSNMLVWILARIVTFLATGEKKDQGLARGDTPTPLSSDQQDSLVAKPTCRYAEWDISFGVP